MHGAGAVGMGNGVAHLKFCHTGLLKSLVELGFFENGAAAFENKHATKNTVEQKRIEQLENKIQTKNEVLSELMEEHVKLKKELGVL